MRGLALLLSFAAIAAAEKNVIVPKGVAAGTSPLSPAIQTQDLIYVSGMVGRNARGEYPRGDIRAQTRLTLDNIGAALKAAGAGFGDVCATNLYITDLRLMPAVDEVYREYFPRNFPARTVLEAMLMTPDAMVEISAVATRRPARRKVIRPDGLGPPSGPWSHAVQAGDSLFLSALHGEGASIQEQTTHVMSRQRIILEAAGMSFAELVFTRIYLADASYYTGLNEAYRKFVTAPPPARATVRADPVRPGAMLQIQSMAVRGSGEERPSGEGHTSPIHSYSVRTGSKLFVTGMTGRAPDGTFARSDIRAQTRQALATIEEQLKRHGFGWGDIVDSVVWLRDTRDFAGMNEVYRELVRPEPPARATVRIAPSSPEALVEVMMIAERR